MGQGSNPADRGGQSKDLKLFDCEVRVSEGKMRGDLKKGAGAAAGEIPGVEKKKVARQRRKEGACLGGERESESKRDQEWERERRESSSSSSSSSFPAPDCLAAVNGWMDGSHFSDENTASQFVIEFQPWSPPAGRSVGSGPPPTGPNCPMYCVERTRERARVRRAWRQSEYLSRMHNAECRLQPVPVLWRCCTLGT